MFIYLSTQNTVQYIYFTERTLMVLCVCVLSTTALSVCLCSFWQGVVVVYKCRGAAEEREGVLLAANTHMQIFVKDIILTNPA